MLFTIHYPNGYLTIHVRNYFTRANITGIKKLIALAKCHCSIAEQLKLLSDLKTIRAYWANYHIRKLSKQERHKKLLPRTTKQLSNLLDKLDKAINLLGN